jgi:hypothetical protein
MKQWIKASGHKFLALAKRFPSRLTEPDDIQNLLNRLHPWATEQPLIRLGPNGDGGYLVPDDLSGISTCFSPGVSLVSGFEKDCADRGMQVFLADKSVDRPAEDHPLFHFTKKFIGATSNDGFMTLDEWVGISLSEHQSDLMLQIDIEGYEYEVFLSTSDSLMRRFRIIVAEFHLLDQFGNHPFFHLASHALDKILQTHACVHIHPNNCCGSVNVSGLSMPRVMEFTFLRRDRMACKTHQTRFPHPLDFDNTSRAPIPLPSCWYSGT